MNIRFRAKEKNGDLTIESEAIKQHFKFGNSCIELFHRYYVKANLTNSEIAYMWVEIDPSTLEIIKE